VRLLGSWVESPNAENGPETTTAEPKFRTYYERLLNIRNDLMNQHTGWREQELETQPKGRQQADAESATTVAMRDAALGGVQGYERLVREVNEAIQRIKGGRYGICELTGQPIETERLDAEPWTAYSIEGQNAKRKQAVRPLSSLMRAISSRRPKRRKTTCAIPTAPAQIASGRPIRE
jgi:RNA polymerase-binding transcription factor DksA